VRLKLDKITKTHRKVFEALREHGIGVNLHYIPVYHHPYFSKMGFDPRNFPVAEAYYKKSISLPIHPGLTRFQQYKVSRLLTEALNRK
jgi:dTDP-4-amino-4,6-dideoxygalactose transaminase